MQAHPVQSRFGIEPRRCLRAPSWRRRTPPPFLESSRLAVYDGHSHKQPQLSPPPYSNDSPARQTAVCPPCRSAGSVSSAARGGYHVLKKSNDDRPTRQESIFVREADFAGVTEYRR